MTIENLQKAIECTEAQRVEADKELTAAKTDYTKAARAFATSGGNEGHVEGAAQAVRRGQARVDGLTAEVESLKQQLSEAEEAERKAEEEEARKAYNSEFGAIERRLDNEVGLAIDTFRRLCYSLALVENLARQTDTYNRYDSMQGARAATRARQRLVGPFNSRDFLAETIQIEEGLRATIASSLVVTAVPLEMPAAGAQKTMTKGVPTPNKIIVAQPIDPMALRFPPKKGK